MKMSNTSVDLLWSIIRQSRHVIEVKYNEISIIYAPKNNRMF